MFESKSLARIIIETINKLTANSEVKSVEPGTVLRQLVDQQQLQVYELQRFVQLLASSVFLSEQSGPFLDTIATLFGLKRNPQRIVQKIGGIRFYTPNGVAIGENMTRDFFVENDVYVYDRYGGSYLVDKERIPHHTLQRSYITVNQTPIQIAVSELKRGDLVSYAPEAPGVFVTNVSDIKLIQDAESDEELRYRIAQHLNSYRMANQHQLRFQQMSVPGVQDQKIVEFPRGVGSVDVYIMGLDLNTDQQLVQPVREVLKDYVQAGIDYEVKTFSKTHVVLGGTLRLKSNQFRTEALESVQAAQRAYIDAIEPGGSLNRHALLGHLIRSCPQLDQIDGFTVYTRQPFEFQLSKPLMQDTYKSLDTEKLMLQPTNWHTFRVM